MTTKIPLLLTDPSPNLRLLVLRELLHRAPDDDEVRELTVLREEDAMVRELLVLQNADGSWRARDGGNDGWSGIKTTAQALLKLGYLGFGPDFGPIKKGAGYLFSHQRKDGSWPLPDYKAESEARDTYSMIPLQTGVPLRGLAAAGYAADPRAVRAYEWLLDKRLPDGAWPTGVKAGQNVFPAGYRHLSHSRYGCRTNTTFAVSALAFHPQRRKSPQAQRGLDLLLAQDTLLGSNLGYEVARIIGVERDNGLFTYFARYDIALMLDLCRRVEASLEDKRIADMVEYSNGLLGQYGLWEYAAHPEASRWITFDLLRSLTRLDEKTDWVSLEPRTPYQPYPKRPKRY